jgi:NAD+ kinase
MIVAIYGRKLKHSVVDAVKELIIALNERQITFSMYEPFYKHLKSVHHIEIDCPTFNKKKQIDKNIDFVFSLGGDGTILDTISWVGKHEIPVVGINFGRLGFLASVSLNQINDALNALENKVYEIDSRSMILLDSNPLVFKKSSFALNEFTVQRSDTSSMITVHTYINNQHLNSYWADGLIVSTPTGSTGYSLSCGGPIIHPTSKSFVITPVAPHNLNVRPMVLSDDVVIKLKVEGRSQKFLATLDSRVDTFKSGVEITLSKAPFEAKLVRINPFNFVNAIRGKLLWGEDTRN